MEQLNFRLDQTLSYSPRRIISLVGPSRSGSTVIKYALALHPDITSLAGEEEPYYKLARNGYPWHESDEFHGVQNPELVRLLIANEVHNYEQKHNRTLLQRYHIEEPPFESYKQCRNTDTLLLKVPQNVYRRGVLEQLYPDAVITYVGIQRSPYAIVNGLLDGWESGQFTARWTPRGWWCFDMPPGWSWDRPLLARCAHQCSSARRYLEKDYEDRQFDIRFEEFEQDWKAVCLDAWQLLGLGSVGMGFLDDKLLPMLAATKEPCVDRWKVSRPWLMEVLPW